MKILIYFKTFLFLIAMLICASSAAAQDVKPAEPPTQTADQRPIGIPSGNPGTNTLGTSTLRQLGLTDEQMQQIRKLRTPTLRLSIEAHKRVREATRLLDEAVYADYADDADIQNKLQQLQQAQAEVAKLRYLNELAVRRILTQEQLVRFREMRQRYEEMRNERMKQMRLDMERRMQRKQMTPSPQRFVPRVKEKPVL